MGRNRFGPVRGPWADDAWTGGWGDDPPFHTPVFVLTHHPREPLEMSGGTTFHFVTDGIESALERAVRAAGGRDVSLGGGADAAQQYLRAGLIDAMEIHVVPMFLGGGSPLFEDLDGGPTGYECVGLVSSTTAAHYAYIRKDHA
jgi:dihydrofolate reductase